MLARDRRSAVSLSATMLALVLGLSTSRGAAAPGLQVSFEAAPGSGPSERILRVSVPGLVWRDADGVVCPEIEGFGRLALLGAPDLPVRRERVAVDPGGELAVSGVDVEWSEGVIPGVLASYPALDPARAPIGTAFQGRDEWWPREAARVASTDGAFRTLRFVEVEVAPVQVNLSAGRFRTATRVTVRLARKRGPPSSASAVSAPADRLTESLASALALGAGEVGRAPLAAPAVPATAAAFVAPSYPAWQIEVDTEGLYRLSYSWVQANLPGLIGRDPRQFRLTTQGVETPILVEGESDGSFDPADAIVFYGQPAVGDLFAPDVDPDATDQPNWQHGDFTDSNVYRLDLAPSPLRIPVDPGTRAPTNTRAVPASFATTLHYEKDELFWGAIAQDGVDHWYLSPSLYGGCRDAGSCPGGDLIASAYCNDGCWPGYVCCSIPSERVVDTPGYVGGPVAMRVRLASGNWGPLLHRSELWVDGTLRSTDDWNDWGEHQQELVLPGPLNATTTVKLRLPLGRQRPGGGYADYDEAAVNWIEFDYNRAFSAFADTLVFPGSNADQEIHLSGFSGAPEVWEISDATLSRDGMSIVSPKRVAVAQWVAQEARFEYDAAAGAPATRRFIAVGPTAWSVPKAAREDLPPSTLDPTLGASLKGTGLGADWVVIAHRSLVGGPQFNAWVSLRQSQGLRTAIVDIRDIYDEFTDGIEDPQAIRDFVAWTLTHWSPAPTYFVLVGDATRNSKNVYGYSPPWQYVPTYMVDKGGDSQMQFYQSDTWFAAVVGTDPLPDALIGRLPLHLTPTDPQGERAEAEGVFSKLVSYEQAAASPPSWAGKALLVTEYDLKWNFFPPHNNIYARFFDPARTGYGGPQTAAKLYEAGTTEADSNNLRAAMKSSINDGAAILSVISHGGWRNLGGDYPFFLNRPPYIHDDIDDLTNGDRLQFHIHGNCISAHFAGDSAPNSGTDHQYTMLEDWVVTPGKGAVAGIGPSHLSYNYNVESIIDSAYDAIFGKRKDRSVGMIDFRVRLELLNHNDPMTVRSHILIGDPATRLIVPLPAAPTITSVEKADSGQLRVRWTAAPGAARYRVYRGENPGADFRSAGETTETTFLDTGLANCTEYFYYVVSLDAGGFESSWSNLDETCLSSPRNPDDCKFGAPENPSPPAAVTGVTVADTQEGGQLRVNWNVADQAADVLRYRVFCGPASGGPYTSQAVVVAPNSAALLGGLEDNRPAYVVVRAEHCTKLGPASAEVAGVPHLVRGINPPDAIDDLRVVLDGPGPSKSNVKLTWTVPTQTVWGTPATVSAVLVYGSQTGPVFALDAAHPLDTLTAQPMNTWTHTNAAVGTGNWWYTVVAVDPAGLRSASGDELPDGVFDLRLTAVDTNADGTVDAAAMSWSPVTRDMDGRPIVVAGYSLYGRSSVLGRGECGPANRLQTRLVGTTTTSAFSADVLYTWLVLAEDSRGAESVW